MVPCEDLKMPPLNVGEMAPQFSAVTAAGDPFNSADFLGKRALVIFFYPKDNTPLCTQEACAFRDSYAQFLDAGVEVVGISSDSAKSHLGFADRHRLPFPLISDANGSLRKLFGVTKTLGFLPGRATYVIDRDGIVRLVFSAQLASQTHVDRALEAVRERPLPTPPAHQ